MRGFAGFAQLSGLINARCLPFPVYRSSFPYTYKEMAVDGDYKTVIPAILLLCAVSYLGYEFVRRNCEFMLFAHCSFLVSPQLLHPPSPSPLLLSVGPTLPHTFNNPEWEAAIRERHLKNKANPIEGISSHVQS